MNEFFCVREDHVSWDTAQGRGEIFPKLEKPTAGHKFGGFSEDSKF
jgi:hypothetical protein